MIERFQGEAGKRKLVHALCDQKCVRNNEPMAKELAGMVEIVPTKKNEPFVRQNDGDTDMYFVLAGKVSIIINECFIAHRGPGEHVGEMALIDPTAKRSASIVPLEDGVVAKISEEQFTEIASKYPTLWRYLALELASRLRQRNQHVCSPNDKPHIFIGSSVESLEPARAVQLGLSHDGFVVRLWTDGVFGATKVTINALMEQVRKSDFAVLVLAADDKVVSRHQQSDAPRDNVVFELGLFMGDLGPERTIIVKPRGVTLKIPTDLLGITPVDYVADIPDNLAANMGPVCTEIRNLVKKTGPKQHLRGK